MTALKLVTGRDKEATAVVEKLESLTELAREKSFVGIAVVMVAQDGRAFTSTLGQGNRLLLLGGVTDLQYTLAKDGDA